MELVRVVCSGAVVALVLGSWGWAQDFGNEGGAEVAKAKRPAVTDGPPGAFHDDVYGSGLTLVPDAAGLKIVKVDDYGYGDASGFEVGDVIVEINGQAVKDSKAFYGALRSIPAGVPTASAQLINSQTGKAEAHDYVVSTIAGVYQSNFGRIELKNAHSGGHNEYKGTLYPYGGNRRTSSMGGKLMGMTIFSGTWKSDTDSGTFNLKADAKGHMFSGTLQGQGQSGTLILIKLN